MKKKRKKKIEKEESIYQASAVLLRFELKKYWLLNCWMGRLLKKNCVQEVKQRQQNESINNQIRSRIFF